MEQRIVYNSNLASDGDSSVVTWGVCPFGAGGETGRDKGEMEDLNKIQKKKKWTQQSAITVNSKFFMHPRLKPSIFQAGKQSTPEWHFSSFLFTFGAGSVLTFELTL